MTSSVHDRGHAARAKDTRLRREFTQAKGKTAGSDSPCVLFRTGQPLLPLCCCMLVVSEKQHWMHKLYCMVRLSEFRRMRLTKSLLSSRCPDDRWLTAYFGQVDGLWAVYERGRRV